MKKHLLAGVSAFALIAAASSAFAFPLPPVADSTVNASFGNASTESVTASGAGNSTVSASFGGNSISSTNAEGFEGSSQSQAHSSASNGASNGSSTGTTPNQFGPGTSGGTSASNYATESNEDSDSDEIGGFGFGSTSSVTQPKTTSTILSGSVTGNNVEFKAKAAAVTGTATSGTSHSTSSSFGASGSSYSDNSAHYDTGAQSLNVNTSSSKSALGGDVQFGSLQASGGYTTSSNSNANTSTSATNDTAGDSSAANANSNGKANTASNNNGYTGTTSAQTGVSSSSNSSGKGGLEASYVSGGVGGYESQSQGGLAVSSNDGKTSSDVKSVSSFGVSGHSSHSTESTAWGNNGNNSVNAAASEGITELDGNTFEDTNSNGILSVNQNTGENALTQESVTVSTGDIAVSAGSLKTADSSPLTSSILSGAVSNNKVEFEAAAAAVNSGYSGNYNVNAASAAGVGLVEGNTFSGLTSNGIASVNQNTGSNALTQQGVTVSTGNITVATAGAR